MKFPNLPIESGGKIILVDVEIVIALMKFKLLLRHDDVYALKLMVSSLFHVMWFQMKDASSSLINSHIVIFNRIWPRKNSFL